MKQFICKLIGHKWRYYIYVEKRKCERCNKIEKQVGDYPKELWVQVNRL